MNTDKLTNPTVRAAIDALQSGDREAWTELLERDAQLFDDGRLPSLDKFNQEALGHERFISIDRIENHGLDLIGHFHSDQWGNFRTYFRFQLSSAGRRLGPDHYLRRLQQGGGIPDAAAADRGWKCGGQLPKQDR
jgi:hypothetical protein